MFIDFYVYAESRSNWGECVQNDVATIQCLVPMFGNIISALIQIAGVALFIVFIIGGFNFLLSGGEHKKIEQAKNTLTYAIIGVVIIVSAYLILLVIRQITGVNVTKFEIPDQPN